MYSISALQRFSASPWVSFGWSWRARRACHERLSTDTVEIARGFGLALAQTRHSRGEGCAELSTHTVETARAIQRQHSANVSNAS